MRCERSQTIDAAGLAAECRCLGALTAAEVPPLPREPIDPTSFVVEERFEGGSNGPGLCHRPVRSEPDLDWNLGLRCSLRSQSSAQAHLGSRVAQTNCGGSYVAHHSKPLGSTSSLALLEKAASRLTIRSVTDGALPSSPERFSVGAFKSAWQGEPASSSVREEAHACSPFRRRVAQLLSWRSQHRSRRTFSSS